MVSLLIPFATVDPRRQQIFDWVLARWHALFPEWEIVIGEDDPEDFNRSRARNNAFEQSTGDLIVISDADTATTASNIQRAVDLIQGLQRPWAIAHDIYYSLTEDFTNRVLAADPGIDLDDLGPWKSNWRMMDKSEAGVLVMPREAYEAVGGYDERFKGWGYEDNAFCHKLNRMWGQYARTQGPMLHLWHDPGLAFDQPDIGHNLDLFEELRHAF